MKKILAFLVMIGFGVVFAQNVLNSMDLSDPPFSKEDRIFLLKHNGFHIEITEYIGGSFYKGTGVIEPKATTKYFIGLKEVNWEEYYDGIGLKNEKEEILHYKKISSIKNTISISSGIVSTLGILCGGINYLGEEEENTFSKNLLITGLIFLIPTIVPQFIRNPYQNINIPLDLIIELSNNANKEIIKLI